VSWENVFMPSVPLLESVVRGTVVYLAVFVLMRLAGRRESGELSTTDVIVIVIISEAASVGIGGKANSITDSVVLIAVILLWSVFLDAAGYWWPALGRLLKPKPRPLIRDGMLQRDTMRREFMTLEELRSQLRLHGIEDIAEVERAHVEPNGMISVVTRDA